MKKDISFPAVNDVAMAAVPESGQWAVYLLNLKENDLTNVIIVSKGYGSKKGEDVKTSTLRHFWEKIKAGSFIKVELIMEELIGLSNEYWLSFYIADCIYDRKYVFLAESISRGNLTPLPLIDRRGVMIN